MADTLDRALDSVDIELDAEDIDLDREQIKMLASIRRLVRREGQKIMANLDNLNAAIDELGADVTAASERVTTSIDELKAEIANLSAGQTIDQGTIDSLTAKVNEADAAVEALDAAVPPPAS